MEPNQSPSYRAVLIGIDAYPNKPLDGCVNDIDQIERILLDRLRVPPERITRLAAPRDGAAVSDRLATLSPTRDGVWNALSRLAEEAGPEDLVFLYYSGHGSQAMVRLNGQLISREALVPVDYRNEGGAPRLLYDFELNGLLARIAQRAGDLTVVLDCCHSAGATREEIGWGAKSRYLPIEGVRELGSQVPEGLAARDSSGLFPAGSIPLLVAACRACELSYETRPGESPRPQGAFTHSLVQLLDAVDRPLSELCWSDLWTALLDRIGRLSSFQHPQIVGHWERRLFGGPWTERDPGYEIRREGKRFRIGAGTLTGLSTGAEVAVYGPQPDQFPAFDSPADRDARIGLLRVTSAERSSSTAVSANGDLQLPASARGRLVKPGKPDRLKIALEPFDPALIRRIKPYAVAVPVGEPGAEAFLRLDEKGWLHLGDTLHGDGRDPQRPPLASFPATARLVLERVVRHYALYVRALRLPERCRDLDGMLRAELLDGRGAAALRDEDLQAPDLPPLAVDPPWSYKVQEGDGFAIRVENRAGSPLYVTVLNCTGSGRVEDLGQVDVPAGSRQVIWREGVLGSPFYPAVGVDRPSAIDRMVIVGTTLPDRDLRYLEVPRSFAEIVRGERDAGTGSAANFPAEKWTATMTTVRIYR